jgi:hypothetical protein
MKLKLSDKRVIAMNFIIEQIIKHYEYFQVRFKGDDNWYFIDLDKLKGVELEGELVKKRTRIWFE